MARSLLYWFSCFVEVNQMLINHHTNLIVELNRYLTQRNQEWDSKALS